MILNKILGSKLDYIIERWRKLHNEELHKMNSSPNIIRMIKVKDHNMGRVCNTHGEGRNACRN
jgi:hypothetical protein